MRSIVCGKGDIRRVWPCSDFAFCDDNILDKRYGIKRKYRWPKVGNPCSQSYCKYMRTYYYETCEVLSNKLEIPGSAKFRKETRWKPEIPFWATMLNLLNYWRKRV